MAQLAATAPSALKRQTERRRVPRIPFKATSVVTEADSSQMVVAQTTELSRFGCFVQTIKPYPRGTRVHIEVSDGGDIFTASGVVAYLTDDGMGVGFNMVQPDNYEILAKWLSRTPRRFERYNFGATAKVRDLGSRNEQIFITRDLSAGGCFVQTAAPLPKGTRIRVCIEHRGAEFTAVGRGTHDVSEGIDSDLIYVQPTTPAIL